MALLTPMLRNLLTPPWRCVVVDDQRRWRGIELYIGALHLARQIERVTSRPHIGFMLPTSGLTSMAIIATWMLGRTIVPINYLLSRKDRDYVIDNAELDAVITVKPMIDRFGAPPDNVKLIELDQMSWRGFPPLRRPAKETEGALAALLYTSGTSGRPKGVMLTVGNLLANVRQCAEWGDFSRNDIFLGVLPQFHCFGITVLTLLPLWRGCRAVYTARFEPRKILALLTHHRPNILLAIPSMLNGLLNAKSASPDSFRSITYLVSGGEPLPQALFDGYRERLGATINEGYGLTETSPVVNWCRPQDHKRFSVGQSLPQVEEKIVSSSGQRLDKNQEGEICIKGPNVMKGYYKLPEETRAVFDSEGFFKTGDIGRIDDDGHLFITGRIKEMMVVGGENVFPRSIEEILDGHPEVVCSAVTGMSDPTRGEVPIAFIETSPGAEVSDQILRAYCRDHLPAYMIPREIHRVAEIPRSATGKILRRDLRDHLGKMRS